MPTKQEICYYALYVIGEVESQWDWGAVNYYDAITLGIVQWWGTRAAGLLNLYRDQAPDDYAKIAESLRNDVSAHDKNDPWWQSRYLTLDEGNSFVSASESDETHQIQENLAISDYGGYYDLFTGSWGMSDPKSIIFTMSMYHQNPQECNNVIKATGGSADLYRVYTTCLNNWLLGQYSSRYTTIYNRLKAWDGESAPPDFGQNGTVSDVGENYPGTEVSPSKIDRIQQVGDNLIVYGRDEYKEGVLFVKSAGQTWVNSVNKNGTNIGGGSSGGGEPVPPDEAASAAVDWLLDQLGKWTYSSDAGRLNAPETGYTDCSGAIWCAFFYGAGVELKTSTGAYAQWTGTMSSVGEEIWRGYSVNDIPWDEMAKGDLLLQASSSAYLWNFDGYMCHIELYTGENQTTVGMPGNGPTTRSGANVDVYGGAAGFMVRRYHA